METVTTRKNKNYTTIFIHAFDDETLNKAVDLKDRLDYAIIKPKADAILHYRKLYNPLYKIEQAQFKEIGHTFEIAGFKFEKIEDMQGCYLSVRDLHEHAKGNLSDFGLIQNSDLIENIFEKKTGRLMFF